MSAAPVQTIRVTLDLSADEVARLDGWIKAHPEPRPSRSDALRHLASLGIDHGREVEMTRRQIAQADRDIRARFNELSELLKLVAAHIADEGEGQKRH